MERKYIQKSLGCTSNVAGNVTGNKLLAIGVHFHFGPCTCCLKTTNVGKTITINLPLPLPLYSHFTTCTLTASALHLTTKSTHPLTHLNPPQCSPLPRRSPACQCGMVRATTSCGANPSSTPSIKGIYQFDDPEDKALDIYKTSATKREDRITSTLGKHFKENPDTARQSLSNAYYEVCSTIKPDIVCALQESGKVSRNVGSLITYLDAKHIRKDNYTLATLYESYFFLTLHEGDDIETHIELLNHAATLLHNARVPNFIDERIRSLHLIKQLPISWEPWRKTYLAAAAITTSVTTSDTTSASANPLSWAATTTALIAATNRRKLDGGASIEAVLHTSHKHSKPKTSKTSTIICTFCSNKGHATTASGLSSATNAAVHLQGLGLHRRLPG